MNRILLTPFKILSGVPGSNPAFLHDLSLGRLYLQQVALYKIPILLDSLPCPSPYLPGVTPITRLNMAMKALTLS